MPLWQSRPLLDAVPSSAETPSSVKPPILAKSPSRPNCISRQSHHPQQSCNLPFWLQLPSLAKLPISAKLPSSATSPSWQPCRPWQTCSPWQNHIPWHRHCPRLVAFCARLPPQTCLLSRGGNRGDAALLGECSLLHKCRTRRTHPLHRQHCPWEMSKRSFAPTVYPWQNHYRRWTRLLPSLENYPSVWKFPFLAQSLSSVKTPSLAKLPSQLIHCP